MCFGHLKACRSLVGVFRIRFDFCKACRRLAELRKVFVLMTAKRVRGLQKFVDCVFTTAKRVGGLHSFEKIVLTSANCIGGLQIF